MIELSYPMARVFSLALMGAGAIAMATGSPVAAPLAAAGAGSYALARLGRAIYDHAARQQTM